MRTGARRKTQKSELPPSPQQHSLQNEITDEGKDQVDYDKGKRQQEQEQPQPQPMNDGGNEYDEEEGGDYEEDDQSGENQGDEDEDEDEDRPKLAEGFYEIEAVRRRRIRKGEKQYLIKWRGWPESANTWEPVENLMSISEYIDAFDQRYGKHRSNRKRKHKHSVASTSNSRKKQQHSPAATDEITDDIPAVKITVIEEPFSVHNSNFTNGTANQSNDLLIGERRERNEVDIQLPELKVASSSNQENASEFSIDIQEDRADVRPTDGSPKVEETKVTRVSPCVGARRRKSGAVRRFRKESNSGDAPAPGDTSEGGGGVVGEEMKNAVVVGNELDCNNIVDVPKSVPAVTKIIKPVNYSTSEHNGTEDICVSFLVRRSDGEEGVVDNKYLKENNPLMLINFYEQHLRYNNPPE